MVDNELVMAVLLDSGFLFASLNASEAEHQSTIRVLKNIREPIIFPVPAVTEVAYLLARDVSNEAAGDFIARLAVSELTGLIALVASQSPGLLLRSSPGLKLAKRLRR